MLRSEYEKFIEMYYDESGIYRVLNPRKEEHYFYTFAKVVDQRTRMVEDETQGYEIGVYVDEIPSVLGIIVCSLPLFLHQSIAF